MIRRIACVAGVLLVMVSALQAVAPFLPTSPFRLRYPSSIQTGTSTRTTAKR